MSSYLDDVNDLESVLANFEKIIEEKVGPSLGFPENAWLGFFVKDSILTQRSGWF